MASASVRRSWTRSEDRPLRDNDTGCSGRQQPQIDADAVQNWWNLEGDVFVKRQPAPPPPSLRASRAPPHPAPTYLQIVDLPDAVLLDILACVPGQGKRPPVLKSI